MKSLITYIYESRVLSTKSNSERRKELEKWLKHKKYDDYVETLNKMLEDPKAKTLLVDGFGGELGDTKLDFSIREIPVSQLIPSQSDLDLDKALKYALSDKHSFDISFNNPIEIKKPIVTFRQNYIIDGHHTWFQGIVLNPKGKILAFDYDGDISPIQMLKAVQGTIASVKAENNNGDSLPSNAVSGQNFYDDDFDEKKMRKYIKDNLNKDIVSDYVSKIDECKDYDSTVDWLVERLITVKTNNYPQNDAPERENMPQLFKGGINSKDKTTAMPTKKGSAMNKLKDEKFMKSVTK